MKVMIGKYTKVNARDSTEISSLLSHFSQL